MSDKLVSISKVSKHFGNRAVVDNVDLQISAGDIVTLIGPNGSGKTTLVRLVLGLMAPDSGQINLRPKLCIGYMPQKLSVAPILPLTVARFLTLGGARARKDLQVGLNQVGAGHLLDSAMQSLSGGETQRVLLARAMLRKPDLLVLDEPTQGVDAQGQSELYALIGRIRDQTGCAVLMVSHDLHLVMAATDQVVCLNHHVCCSGHPSTVVKEPSYLELFGAESAELAVYSHQHDHAHGVSGEVSTHSECKHG